MFSVIFPDVVSLKYLNLNFFSFVKHPEFQSRSIKIQMLAGNAYIIASTITFSLILLSSPFIYSCKNLNTAKILNN